MGLRGFWAASASRATIPPLPLLPRFSQHHGVGGLIERKSTEDRVPSTSNQEISATWLFEGRALYFVVGHFWDKLQPRSSRYGCLNTGEMDCAGDKEWKIAATVVSRCIVQRVFSDEKKKKEGKKEKERRGRWRGKINGKSRFFD